MSDLPAQISELLPEAAETHHRVYASTDGDDPDWATWYSDWRSSTCHGCLAAGQEGRPQRADICTGHARQAVRARGTDGPLGGLLLTRTDRSLRAARVGLGRMWYLALRRNLQPRESWTVSLDEHLAWMREQHKRGSILMSGPSGDRAMGIYLIRAGSREEAEQISASDPFTAAGHCTAEVIEWEIHQILGVGPFSAAAFRATRD